MVNKRILKRNILLAAFMIFLLIAGLLRIDKRTVQAKELGVSAPTVEQTEQQVEETRNSSLNDVKVPLPDFSKNEIKPIQENGFLESKMMTTNSLALFAVESPVQLLSIPSGPYQSDPGYDAVLLQGGSTNGHTIPYLLWIQNGRILIAVKANKEVLTMTLNGHPSSDSMELPIGALLSVDAHLNLDPKSGMDGATDKARWKIFEFPLNTLDGNGVYTISTTSQGGGFNLINIVVNVTIPTATANLTKTWVNGPKNPVAIQLYYKVGVNGTPVPYKSSITLIADSTGKATYQWLKLPLTNSSAQELIYFIEEADPGQNYEVINFLSTYDPTTMTYTFSLTNNYVPPKGPITAEKIWVGGPKPMVSFQLYRKAGMGLEETVGTPVSLDGVVDPNEKTPWKYTWEAQALKTLQGADYSYYAKEVTVLPNYTKVENGLIITNTYTSPLGSVVAKKVWSGGSNRPEVTFQLYRKVGTESGLPVGTSVKLDGIVGENERTAWEYTWDRLPTHRQTDGMQYTYYVVETAVPVNYTADTVDDLTVINTYKSPLRDVTAEKIWDGGSEVNRPSVIFQLYRKVGIEPAEMVGIPAILDGNVDESELAPWQITWKNLQTIRQGDGLPYDYFVRETVIPLNYTPDTQDDLVVTNTYTLSTMIVQKNVAGNFGDLTRDFNFTATLGGSLLFPEPLVGSGYSLSADKKTAEFNLKHGEIVTLVVPIGAELTLREEPIVDYKVKYLIGNTEYSSNSLTMLIPKTETSVVFTNSKDVLVDTGVSTNSLPYIYTSVLLSAGLVLITLQSKRRQVKGRGI